MIDNTELLDYLNWDQGDPDGEDYEKYHIQDEVPTEFVLKDDDGTFYIVHNYIFKTLKSLLKQNKIIPTDFVLYSELRTYSDAKYKDIWPKIDTLVKETGFSEKTVRRSLQRLKNCGIIGIAKNGTKNTYEFNTATKPIRKSAKDKNVQGHERPVNRSPMTGKTGQICPVIKTAEIATPTQTQPEKTGGNYINITRSNTNNNNNKISSVQKKEEKSSVPYIEEKQSVNSVVVVDNCNNWISIDKMQELEKSNDRQYLMKSINYINWMMDEKHTHIDRPMGLLISMLKRQDTDFTEYESYLRSKKMKQESQQNDYQTMIEKHKAIEERYQDRINLVQQIKAETAFIETFQKKYPKEYQEIYDDIWDNLNIPGKQFLNKTIDNLAVRPQLLDRIMAFGG